MTVVHLIERHVVQPTVTGFTRIDPLFSAARLHRTRQPKRIFIDDLWGDGFIADKVFERPAGAPANGTQDVPVVRRVVLLRLYDYLPVREMWSASDGSYRFENINRAYEYVVISFDHTNNYKAVLADKIKPAQMTTAAAGGAGG